MMIMLKRITSLLFVCLVAACGGSGDAGCSVFGGTGTSANTCGSTPTTPTVANLVLTLDSPQLINNGSNSVGVTVTATDATNNVVSGAPVVIAADSQAVVIAAGSSTDTSGKVTASVFAGSENRSNRTVTVTATSGSLVKTATFDVTGNKVTSTVIGSPFTPSAAGQVNYRVVDSNGNPMSGQTVTVTGIGADATGTTDVNGQYVYGFTAPATAGTYTLTGTSAGVAKPDTITVAAASTISPVPAGSILSASVSASPSVVAVNTPTSTTNQASIRALFSGASNAPIKNVRVRFDLNSDVNSIGGTFTTGTSIVLSDANGQATTAYIPGTRFSPTDGVTIRACYGYTDADLAGGACPNFATTTLTVASEAISVSIGTNKKIIDNVLTYIQEFVVTVVDSSGAAKAGVQVTPSVDLLRFGKGQWVKLSSGWGLSPTQYFYNPANNASWYLEDPRTAAEKAADPTFTPTISTQAACWNEDRNRNGVLEAAEDSKASGYSLAAGGNGNGKLDPSKSDVAISLVNGAATTDASGKITLQIEYSKNLGSWLEYKILVTAGSVGGTEGRATWTDVLGVPDTDVKADTVPAFVFSRYGVLAGCDVSQ